MNLIKESRNKKSLLPFGSPQIAGSNHRNLISLNPTVVAHSRDYALGGNRGLNPSNSGVSLPPISNFKTSVDGESQDSQRPSPDMKLHSVRKSNEYENLNVPLKLRQNVRGSMPSSKNIQDHKNLLSQDRD